MVRYYLKNKRRLRKRPLSYDNCFGADLGEELRGRGKPRGGSGGREDEEIRLLVANPFVAELV